MVFLSMRSLLVVALLQPNIYSVLAQSLSGTWKYPLQTLTVNNIDTVVLEWTSNYTTPSWMNVWCNNGGAQILGSAFTVLSSGSYPFILDQEAAAQTSFPVECFAQLATTSRASTGLPDTFTMTFTSNAEATATTFSDPAMISSTTSPLSSTLATQTSSTTPSITASTVPALSDHKSKGLVAGAIAVGVIASVAIIVLLFWMLFRRRAKQRAAAAAAQNTSRATDWAEDKEMESSIWSSPSGTHELGDDPYKRHELEEGTINHEPNALASGDRIAGGDAVHELPAEGLEAASSVPGEGDAADSVLEEGEAESRVPEGGDTAGSVLEEGEAASTLPEHSTEGG